MDYYYLNADEVRQKIIDNIDSGDWDDLLRIYRAAADPDAELVDTDNKGDFKIKTNA